MKRIIAALLSLTLLLTCFAGGCLAEPASYKLSDVYEYLQGTWQYNGQAVFTVEGTSITFEPEAGGKGTLVQSGDGRIWLIRIEEIIIEERNIRYSSVPDRAELLFTAEDDMLIAMEDEDMIILRRCE